MARGFTRGNHGYSVEGEPWSRNYGVECTCGWARGGFSSRAAADDAGRDHLAENGDDYEWVD